MQVYNDGKQDWPGYYEHEYVNVWCFDLFGWDGSADLLDRLMYLPAIELNVWRYDNGDWWAPGGPHYERIRNAV